MGRTGPEDLERQLRFHRLEWRVQRIGWVIIAIFLVLALAGLFGGGPLSNVRAEAATGRIDYERFVRSGSPTEIVITPPSGAEHGVSRVEITADYLAAFQIERVTPQPTTVRVADGRLVYEFAAATSGGFIAFEIDPQKLWRHRAEVRIDGGPPLQISQLTYP
jgi:hypothetical protein